MNGLENYKFVLDQLDKFIHLVNENFNYQSAERREKLKKVKKLRSDLSSKYYDLCVRYDEGKYED